MIVLDTNVLSELLAPTPAPAVDRPVSRRVIANTSEIGSSSIRMSGGASQSELSGLRHFQMSSGKLDSRRRAPFSMT
ncbi:MAG TPA: hypothetical protein DIC56_16325 [Rhizobium sp.]|nr:hypothetical protein [Rhizobium sp.]